MCVVHLAGVSFIYPVCRFLIPCVADPIWGVCRSSYTLSQAQALYFCHLTALASTSTCIAAFDLQPPHIPCTICRSHSTSSSFKMQTAKGIISPAQCSHRKCQGYEVWMIQVSRSILLSLPLLKI